MFLTAQKILEAQDRRTKNIPCPEWGGDVLIGTMGALDRARIADWIDSLATKQEPQSQEDEKEKVLTCDSPGGKPEQLDDDAADDDAADDENHENQKKDDLILTKEQHTELMLRYLTASILDPETQRLAFNSQQIEDLGQKDPGPLWRLYDAALELNADTKLQKKELEKNFEGTAAEDSGGD